MSEPTFRDFAGAVMQGDVDAAGNVLKVLLGLEADAARAAAENFAAKMKSEGQGFMMKAMGLRTVLTDGKDEDIGALLSELFGLSKEAITEGIKKLRATYS